MYERGDYRFFGFADSNWRVRLLLIVYVNFRQKPPSNRALMLNPPTLMSKQFRELLFSSVTDVVRLERGGEET